VLKNGESANMRSYNCVLGIKYKYGRDDLGVKKWQKMVLVAKFPTKHFCDGKNIADIYF
jgi:hypothetical protein